MALLELEGIGKLYHQGEVEGSKYNFEESDAQMLFTMMDMFEVEAKKLIETGLVLPAYEYTLKCSHTFNLLDARGAISVTERTRFIGRVRDLAREVAHLYAAQREEMGYPLIKSGDAATGGV